MTGESASADYAADAKFPNKLKANIEVKGYSTKQIFYADETGHFLEEDAFENLHQQGREGCTGIQGNER